MASPFDCLKLKVSVPQQARCVLSLPSFLELSSFCAQTAVALQTDLVDGLKLETARILALAGLYYDVC